MGVSCLLGGQLEPIDSMRCLQQMQSIECTEPAQQGGSTDDWHISHGQLSVFTLDTWHMLYQGMVTQMLLVLNILIVWFVTHRVCSA